MPGAWPGADRSRSWTSASSRSTRIRFSALHALGRRGPSARPPRAPARPERALLHLDAPAAAPATAPAARPPGWRPARRTGAVSRPSRSSGSSWATAASPSTGRCIKRPQQPLFGRPKPRRRRDGHCRGLGLAPGRRRLADLVPHDGLGDPRLVREPVGELVADGRVRDRRRDRSTSYPGTSYGCPDDSGRAPRPRDPAGNLDTAATPSTVPDTPGRPPSG